MLGWRDEGRHNFIRRKLTSFHQMLPGPPRTIHWVAPRDGSFLHLIRLLCRGAHLFLVPPRLWCPTLPPSLIAPMEGKVHPSHCLSFLTSRPACEPYGPLASGAYFLSQGTESFRRKLQLHSLKTDCKFFIWGLILSGWSTLVLTAFLT